MVDTLVGPTNQKPDAFDVKKVQESFKLTSKEDAEKVLILRDELKLIEKAVKKVTKAQQKRGGGSVASHYYSMYSSGGNSTSEQTLREISLKVDEYKRLQKLKFPLSPSESESESQQNAPEGVNRYMRAINDDPARYLQNLDIVMQILSRRMGTAPLKK